MHIYIYMQNVDQVHTQDYLHNVTEPQAMYNIGAVRSGLAKACCTQAGPAHAAGHVEMAWTDQSHLFWHVLPVASIAIARRDLSPVTGRHRQIAMLLPLSL